MSEATVEEQIAAKFAGAPLPEAPAEEPADTADTTAEPEVAAPEAVEAAETLLAGKYKDTADLERAYLEAQSALGRQGNELSELRKLSDEIAQLRSTVETPAGPQYDPGSVDEFLAENPQQIPAMAQRAIDEQDGYLYQRSLTAWQEYDPVGAMDFHAQRVSDAKVAQLRSELQPVVAGVRQTEATGQFHAAYEAAAAKHDDFAQVLNSINQETLDGFPPEVLATLQTGDQQSKERVLETLYRWTKAEQAGNLTAAVTQAAAQQKADSVAAKTGAAVATTSGAQDHLAAEVAPNDAFRQAFRDSDAFKKYSGQI